MNNIPEVAARPELIDVNIPGHKAGRAPDHKMVGSILDGVLKKHFMNRRVVIRCIGSQDHPGVELNRLIDQILESGTDKYDENRPGVGYTELAKRGIKVDFYGEPIEVTDKMVFMTQQVWEMHHSAIGDRGYGVHVDLVLIYDAERVDMVMNLYDFHETSDGFVFKEQTNKAGALLGIIRITG